MTELIEFKACDKGVRVGHASTATGLDLKTGEGHALVGEHAAGNRP